VRGTPEPAKPFKAEQVFTKVPLVNGVDMVPVPETAQWLIMEHGGKIWCVDDDVMTEKADLALDLKKRHPGSIRAYGMAFHPRFRENREIFLTYTVGDKKDDGSRLSRFRVSQTRPLLIDPASEEILLTWVSGGHNGAAMAFGPDGFLYLSTGDADVPAPPDPRLTGQSLDDLLSCILRLDVDRRDAGKAYAAPKDNPFRGHKNARPEIWAYGLRNPWKISFDPRDGNLWCGDVGWEQWENIFLIKRGGNYGWSCMEGNYSLFPERQGPTKITPPVVSHSHDEAASITGGFVYHGSAFPELEGAYVYADYETGKMWALWHDGKQVTRHDAIADTGLKISTFARGEDGELFFIHYGEPSSVHRLARHPDAGKPSSFPMRLSESGLFSDVVKQTPMPGVQPFEIRTPMWADGATASRFVAIPDRDGIITKLTVNKNKNRIESKVTWPKDMVLAKTITMEMERGNPGTAKKIETQMLHYDGIAWNAYSYRWNHEGTDAAIVGALGEERVLELKGADFPGGRHRYAYRFHSRAECLRCHNSWNQFALGFQPQQMTEACAGTLLAAGLFDADYLRKSEARLVSPYDGTASLEARSRAWLHANCAHCHRENGGGSVPLMVNAEINPDAMRALDEKPLRGDLGIAGAKVIAPGDPWRSVLLHRIATTSAGHMPVIGPRLVDEGALRLLADWIASLGANDAPQAAPVSEPLTRPDVALAFAVASHDLESPVFRKAVNEAAKSPDAHIRGLFERFLPDEQRAATLGANPDAKKILALKGDAARGAALLSITGKAGACLACHFINGAGREFGPDLSKIGARLKREQLLESLLQPSKVISRGFQAVVIESSDSPPQTGFIVKQTAAETAIKLMTGQTHVVPAASITSQKSLPLSLMPEGLLQTFTAQEAADLVAHLAGLK
jgi:putative heme-binding domain-containing protein